MKPHGAGGQTNPLEPPARFASPPRLGIGSAAGVALFAALVVMLIGLWQITRARDLALADAEQTAVNLSRALSQHAARMFESVDIILSGAVERIEGNPERDHLKGFLARRINPLPQILDLVAADETGRWIADTAEPDVARDSAASAYFAWHRDHEDRGLHMGNPSPSFSGTIPVLVLSRRLNHPEGGFAGVVAAEFMPGSLEDFYKSVHIGSKGTISLFGEDGLLLARYPAPSEDVNRDPARVRLFMKRFEAPSGTFASHSPIDGVERIVAFEHVKGYPLVLVASVAQEDALARWHGEALVAILALAGAAAVLVALGFGLERQRRIALGSHRAARENDRLYRLLADASSDMIERLDLDGIRRYVSPASRDIVGLAPAEMTGTHAADLIHAEDAEGVEGVIAGVAAGRQDQDRSVHRIRRKDGAWIWVEARFRLVRDKASGEPLEVLSTSRDITQRETLRRQLALAHDNLLIAEEIAHVGHWRVESDGNALTWSDEVYRIHGLDPSLHQPTVETAIAAYHPDDRAEVARCVGEAVEGRRTFNFRLRILRPDGETRHVMSRGLCETDPRTGAVTAIFGVILDVTELTGFERQAREKSALLEATLDNMDQALVKVAADGTIELANRRFAALLDLPASLLEGPRPNFEDVLDHLDRSGEYNRADVDRESHVAMLGAPLTLGTYERSRPNGTILEVRTVSAPDGAVVRTYADVTARHRAEAARRESEARYRILAESTNDVILQLGLDCRRLYVSPACRTILGYTPDEMLGQPANGAMHPDEAADGRALLARLAAGEIEGDRAVKTYRARHQAGHYVWIEAGMTLVRDEASGAPVCVTCTLRDVTERQRAARHLEQARAAAEQAARAKADFLANMSHELRTPLTGMLGVHDLLRTDPGLNPNQHRLLALASEAGQSLLGIVNDILDFSKIDAGQLVIESLPFEVHRLLAGCRALISRSLGGKAIALTLHAPDLPAWLVGDANRIRQILLNLLNNAVKFTDRGVIRLGASYDVGRDRLRVEVADTGIGIPPEKLSMLFDRFSQADASTTRRYGGTGLGLAISKRLVDLMAGSIGVESAAGRGSTFWFELPLPIGIGERPQAKGAVAPVQDGPRVLLAEDNPMNGEIIASMLSQRGYRVTMAVDGLEAVEAFEGPDTFHLILMDLQMPVMDGLAATAAIRRGGRAGGAPPIIGLSANAMAEDVERCFACGMDAHVAKPIDWPELFATMDRLVVHLPAARRAEAPAPGPDPQILDEKILGELLDVIGGTRLATMLSLFEEDVGRRMNILGDGTPAVVADQTHSLAGLAGQLGFVSLSRLCQAIELEVRRNQEVERLQDLREAAARAIDASRSFRVSIAA